MITRTGDFILVHFLDDEPVGKTWERRRSQWPLHITLVPWFGSASEDELIEALRQFGATRKAFGLVLGETERFNENTVVSLIQNQTDILSLHKDLLTVVQKPGVQLTSTRWVGDAFKAHVTHHEGVRIPQTGGRLSVGTFSLVALLPLNQCKVIHHIELRAES